MLKNKAKGQVLGMLAVQNCPKLSVRLFFYLSYRSDTANEHQLMVIFSDLRTFVNVVWSEYLPVTVFVLTSSHPK